MEALIARAIQILIALGGAYFLTLWFALVVWTFQDIQSRSRSVVAQIFSTLVVMIFSLPGLLVYMILRPRYTLDDAFQRSLEEEYLMQDLEELPLCPACQQYVEDEWVFCPNCRTELRDGCVACERLIDLRWEICPYCGTEQYPEAEEALPGRSAAPLVTPSPQFLGQPQLTQSQARQLSSSEQRTRRLVPSTVRVDLVSGDVDRESVPGIPVSSNFRSIDDLTGPRRVSLSGNGLNDADESARRGHQWSGRDEPAATIIPAAGESDPDTEFDSGSNHATPPEPRKRSRRRGKSRKRGSKNS